MSDKSKYRVDLKNFVESCSGRFKSGNNGRVKWTIEKALDFFQGLFELATEDMNILTFAQLLARAGSNEPHMYWLINRFAKRTDKDGKSCYFLLKQYKAQISDILEAKAIDYGLMMEKKTKFIEFLLSRRFRKKYGNEDQDQSKLNITVTANNQNQDTNLFNYNNNSQENN